MSDAADLDGLRRRYAEERGRRLRPDAIAQYIEAEGEHAHFAEDPWADRPASRDSIDREVDVVVVGGGFGGLLSAAHLKQAGVDDIMIVEKAADFGGTWYWNRYPGAACDTESYIYLPLLEETGYIPTRRYARAPEIAEHAKRIARTFGLYDAALFQTIIDHVEWREDTGRWIVRTNRGDTLRARFVVLAGGPLHKPKLPGIPGIETFEGRAFHTGRWDYGYTGGDSDGGLTGLADKKVGIIGTGATAVQAVPHLGASAKELYVFQRTPSVVAVRADRATDPDWAASLQPGWQRARMANFTSIIEGVPVEENLVQDNWTDLLGEILLAPLRASPPPATLAEAGAIVERADFRKMNEIRDRVSAIVRDPVTAEALKPWYKAFCKRPCFHDDYLDTFNRPNVHLIDTKGLGVDRITAKGAVVDGKEYALDCLIFATGFEIGSEYHKRMGFDVVGRDGLTLREKWRDGASTLHGFFTRAFPNCLIISVTQGGHSANFAHLIDEQSQHIAYVIAEAMRRGLRTIEPAEEAERAWVDEVIEAAQVRGSYLAECTPGYYNNEGHMSEYVIRSGPYFGGPIAYIGLLHQWRAEGKLTGLETIPLETAPA